MQYILTYREPTFCDVLECWHRIHFARTTDSCWTGTAMELHKLMFEEPTLREALNVSGILNSQKMGHLLSLMSKMGVGSIEITNNGSRGRTYSIQREMTEGWAGEFLKIRQENSTPRNFAAIKAKRTALNLPNGVSFYTSRLTDCAPDKIEERLDDLNCGTTYIQHRAFYKVCIHVLGKQRAIGNRVTPRKAAMLFDSALFWLWGYVVRPDARKFNLFKPGMKAPELLLTVKELRKKLSKEAGTECLDFYTSTRIQLNSMNHTVDTRSMEYQNFVFKEPEPTADDFAQAGVSNRAEWFEKHYAAHGNYEEQKQCAFRNAKEDARLAKIQQEQGEEGQRRLAEVERTEHEHQLAKRNAKRAREMEQFKGEVRRKANALQPYLVGIQKWASIGARPVLVPDATTTLDEMKEHARAVKTYDKALAAIPQKATNLLSALNAVAGDMAQWYQDLKTKDITKPLADAIAQLKAALPADLPGEEVAALRARIALFEEQVVMYCNDTFEIAPFILRVRPGQPVPYNYRYVPENSDFCECWENLSRKE